MRGSQACTNCAAEVKLLQATADTRVPSGNLLADFRASASVSMAVFVQAVSSESVVQINQSPCEARASSCAASCSSMVCFKGLASAKVITFKASAINFVPTACLQMEPLGQGQGATFDCKASARSQGHVKYGEAFCELPRGLRAPG